MTYNVKAGTEAYVMSSAGGKPWVVRKDLTFTPEQVVINPEILDGFRKRDQDFGKPWNLDSIDVLLFAAHAEQGSWVFAQKDAKGEWAFLVLPPLRLGKV